MGSMNSSSSTSSSSPPANNSDCYLRHKIMRQQCLQTPSLNPKSCLNNNTESHPQGNIVQYDERLTD